MSDFNRQMAKMMSGTKTKVICGEVIGNKMMSGTKTKVICGEVIGNIDSLTE